MGQAQSSTATVGYPMLTSQAVVYVRQVRVVERHSKLHTVWHVKYAVQLLPHCAVLLSHSIASISIRADA